MNVRAINCGTKTFCYSSYVENLFIVYKTVAQLLEISFFLKMLICLKLLFFRYALLGAASFLGGSMRITVSLCVIMVEITNNLKFLPLIMLVLLISKVVLVFPRRKHCMTLIKKALLAFIYKFWCFLFCFEACCEILVGCG